MEKPKGKFEAKRRSKLGSETDEGESSQPRDDSSMDHEDRRLSSRVKKPKLVYDPSDQSAPYKKVNLEDLTKSPKKKEEVTAAAAAAAATATAERKVSVYKGTVNFEDKTCKVCWNMLEGTPSVVCMLCGDGYHCQCHVPRVGKTTRKATWKCFACRPKDDVGPAKVVPLSSSRQSTSAETSRRSSVTRSELQSEEDNEFVGFEDSATEGGNKKTNTTKTTTTTTAGSNGKSNGVDDGDGKDAGDDNDDEDEGTLDDGLLKIDLGKAKALLNISHNTMPNMDTIPDCSTWECEEVFEYFNKFFPKEAYIFKEQEIDGTSLMLMTRSDMLKFNLKLGPALNIYRHIVMLQSRSYDPRKTWK